MKITAAALSGLLAVSGMPCGSASTGGMPEHHPALEILSKFHLKCPYANDWVVKGPMQAAVDMGLLNGTAASDSDSVIQQHHNEGHPTLRRRAQEQLKIAGSCVYTNQWSGQPACLELRGDGWTTVGMEGRCDSETDGALSVDAPCETPDAMMGWCVVTKEEGSMLEATPLAGMAGMECSQMKSTCETFMAGTFDGMGDCASGEAPKADEAKEGSGGGGFPYTFASPPDGPNTCAIAPGAIGAGHMAGYSEGYSANCEGTPAEGSPYMWPMAWAADIESKSMEAGSDDVKFHSKGRVYYRSDKNWKRQDWWYQHGIMRLFGAEPCKPENLVEAGNAYGGCLRNIDDYRTMLHKGNKMVFINWANNTEPMSNDPSNIVECSWLDMSVVGNIRPDWFMDSRGDSTDVQYMGDQHVVLDNQPRLVKQWRKQDFAQMYFVMSMLANPKDDEIHWPMMLNVPGEGFGDDMLQTYYNHTLLTDEDDHLFLLDEMYESMGGTCEQLSHGREGGGGPPTGAVHIPSNLEVEPNAWFSNVYTFSPVWEPPAKLAGPHATSTATGEIGMATTEKGKISVESCYDEANSAVQLSFKFKEIEMIDGDQLPWMALGYRPSEDCLMNPRDGSDTELILLKSSPVDASSMEAHFGLLPLGARRFNETAVASISESSTPLSEKEGYSEVRTVVPTAAAAVSKSVADGSEADSVMLHFKQSMESVPEAMHLMYAIGASSEIGYHKTRECFEIVAFPTCPSQDELEGMSSSSELSESMEETGSEASTQAVSGGHATGVLAALSFVVCSMLF